MGTPLIASLSDAGLTTRAYNLGLKIVPNLQHVLSGVDLDYWERHLAEMKDVLAKALVRPPYLRLISSGHKLTLPARSGKRTIAKAKRMFLPGYIHSDFVDYGLDVRGVATPETDVQVYELVRDGEFTDIYNGVGVDLDKLVLTQDQILTFVEICHDWLRTYGPETFFIMKNGKMFFVVGVVEDAPGRSIYPANLSYRGIWHRSHFHRFVLPQLTPASVAEEVAGK